MYVVSLLFVLLSLSVVSAQEGRMKNESQEQVKIPATLSEAHAELERILPPEELAKIDAMVSEKGMIEYHFGLGGRIRNDWGLWQDSPLAKHMQQLGFTHPDDMSSVILETFWCRRHGRDLRLEERAAEYRKYWAAARKAREEETNRVQKAKEAIQNMMMGLRIERRDVPRVRMPDRTRYGLRVRFLSPFRGGVFLSAYCSGRRKAVITDGFYVAPADGEVHTKPGYDDVVARGFYFDPADGKNHKMKPGDDFYTRGYYFDQADHKIHEIRMEGGHQVYAAVVAGKRAWFASLTDEKAVLVGVSERDRVTVPLPQDDEIPDLGFDGQSLLAVYSRTIYRLTDLDWTLVHSGDILLPRSGPPPQRHGNMVFLRDEWDGENRKRLWWLTLGEQAHLSALDRDVGLVGEEGPRWENSSSYCVTNSGDLWVCVGETSASNSLLRRSKDGSYLIAIMNNSVRFAGDLLGSKETDQGLSVSAVNVLSDETLLLIGNAGLYRLRGNELAQELAFMNTCQRISDNSNTIAPAWHWDPGNVLLLDDRSYLVSGSFGGVYLLRKDDDGQWAFLSLDEELGDPVVW